MEDLGCTDPGSAGSGRIPAEAGGTLGVLPGCRVRLVPNLSGCRARIPPFDGPMPRGSFSPSAVSAGGLC